MIFFSSEDYKKTAPLLEYTKTFTGIWLSILLVQVVDRLMKIAKNEEVNVAKAHLFESVSMLSKMCR